MQFLFFLQGCKYQLLSYIYNLTTIPRQKDLQVRKSKCRQNHATGAILMRLVIEQI